MSPQVPHRQQDTGASSKRGAFLPDFHFLPENLMLGGKLARACCDSLVPSMWHREAASLSPNILTDLRAIPHLDC